MTTDQMRVAALKEARRRANFEGEPMFIYAGQWADYVLSEAERQEHNMENYYWVKTVYPQEERP